MPPPPSEAPPNELLSRRSALPPPPSTLTYTNSGYAIGAYEGFGEPSSTSIESLTPMPAPSPRASLSAKRVSFGSAKPLPLSRMSSGRTEVMDEHEDDPLAGENAWEEEDVRRRRL